MICIRAISSFVTNFFFFKLCKEIVAFFSLVNDVSSIQRHFHQSTLSSRCILKQCTIVPNWMNAVHHNANESEYANESTYDRLILMIYNKYRVASAYGSPHVKCDDWCFLASIHRVHNWGIHDVYTSFIIIWIVCVCICGGDGKKSPKHRLFCIILFSILCIQFDWWWCAINARAIEFTELIVTHSCSLEEFEKKKKAHIEILCTHITRWIKHSFLYLYACF